MQTLHTVVRVEYLPCQEKKPFFAKPASIDSLLPSKYDAQCLFHFLISAAYSLAYSSEAVLNQALAPDVESEELLHGLAIHDAIKEGISSLRRHLPTCVIL